MPNPNGLRDGVSTGSCAAAAAKASAIWAVSGTMPKFVTVTTPSGRELSLETVRIGEGVCGVVKDAGDDPDATNGLTVTAQVEILPQSSEIIFAAGEGVGTVTLPGLKVPVGEPAINPVPRLMIEDAVRSVLKDGGVKVTISVPGGEKTALHTFNPRLGVTGGISILGTSGIVRPMNEQSIFDSLTLELSTHKAQGRKILAVTFGNTGEESLRKAWNIKGRCVVQTGNYIGYVLDEAVRFEFERILLCGHPGKLLKVAAGTFNTHNRTGDGRKEALCTHAALEGFDRSLIKKIYESPTTEAAMGIINAAGLQNIWSVLAQVTAKCCTDRAFGDIKVEASYIDNSGAILGSSTEAPKFAEELRHEQ